MGPSSLGSGQKASLELKYVVAFCSQRWLLLSSLTGGHPWNAYVVCSPWPGLEVSATLWSYLTGLELGNMPLNKPCAFFWDFVAVPIELQHFYVQLVCVVVRGTFDLVTTHYHWHCDNSSWQLHHHLLDRWCKWPDLTALDFSILYQWATRNLHFPFTCCVAAPSTQSSWPAT